MTKGDEHACEALFGISVAFGVIAWGIVAALYFWPLLRAQARVDALRPLLPLHSFRFVGLAFLVKGVVAPDVLHSDFHRSAASHHARACVLDFAPARYCRRSRRVAIAQTGITAHFGLLLVDCHAVSNAAPMPNSPRPYAVLIP
jgi:hypothetical protein